MTDERLAVNILPDAVHGGQPEVSLLILHYIAYLQRAQLSSCIYRNKRLFRLVVCEQPVVCAHHNVAVAANAKTVAMFSHHLVLPSEWFLVHSAGVYSLHSVGGCHPENAVLRHFQVHNPVVHQSLFCGRVILSQASDTATCLVIHNKTFAKIADEIVSVAVIGKSAHYPSIEFHALLVSPRRGVVTVHLIACGKPIFSLTVTVNFLGAYGTGRTVDDIALMVEMIDSLTINGAIDGAVGAINNSRNARTGVAPVVGEVPHLYCPRLLVGKAKHLTCTTEPIIAVGIYHDFRHVDTTKIQHHAAACRWFQRLCTMLHGHQPLLCGAETDSSIVRDARIVYHIASQ